MGEQDFAAIAEAVLAASGGAGNVAQASHCMTRLRLNFRDEAKADIAALKRIPAVMAVVKSGGQTQVVIGQQVGKVYQALCAQGHIEAQELVNENLDAPAQNPASPQKFSLRKIGANILNYLAGSLTPLIPVIIAAAMFKTVLVVIGPDMLKLVDEGNDLFVLLNFLYDGGFYFLPVYIGYTAAKKLNVTPVLGMYMGCVLIAPAFIKMASEGAAFSVYGIPIMVNNYSQSVLPVILSVWVLSYVEKFFKKHLPDSLTTIFAPFLTMVVMVPVSFCALAPAGAFIGQYVGAALVALGNAAGFIGVMLVAAFWPYLVMSGMHMVLIVTAITIIMQNGSESFILNGGGCAQFAVFGMAFAALLAIKEKKEKALCAGYLISGLIGGVTEPTLYGVGFKYKKPFITMSLGAALGGLYTGLTHVSVHVFGATNLLAVLGFLGGGTANFINGMIGYSLAFAASAALTFLFGFKGTEAAAGLNG